MALLQATKLSLLTPAETLSLFPGISGLWLQLFNRIAKMVTVNVTYTPCILKMFYYICHILLYYGGILIMNLIFSKCYTNSEFKNLHCNAKNNG